MYGSRGDVVFSWGEDKAAAANKTPIKQNADQSRQAGRQERKKERQKEGNRKPEPGPKRCHGTTRRLTSLLIVAFPCKTLCARAGTSEHITKDIAKSLRFRAGSASSTSISRDGDGRGQGHGRESDAWLAADQPRQGSQP